MPWWRTGLLAFLFTVEKCHLLMPISYFSVISRYPLSIRNRYKSTINRIVETNNHHIGSIAPTHPNQSQPIPPHGPITTELLEALEELRGAVHRAFEVLCTLRTITHGTDVRAPLAVAAHTPGGWIILKRHDG